MSDTQPSFLETACAPLNTEFENDAEKVGRGEETSAVRSGRVTTNEEYKRIFLLLFLAQFWTLIMTFIPVVGDVQPKDYYDRKGWSYGGSDVMRFLEPVISLPLNFVVFCYSGILMHYDIRDPLQESDKSFFIGLWFLAAAVCQQGAGFHSCSNMLKNAFETLPIYTNGDDGTREFYYYIRTWWEHLVSHYMYAAGYAFMAISCMFAYRHHAEPIDGGLSGENKLYLLVSAICYGMVTSGVAINFPAGSVVAIVYLLCYGILFLLGYRYYLWRTTAVDASRRSQSGWFGFNLLERPVMDYFILSYTVSLVIVLIWVAYVGSVWITRGDLEH